MSATRRIKEPPAITRPVKFFTPEEADRALVLVRRIVRDVVTYYRQVLDCQEILEASQSRGSREQVEQAQKDTLRCIEKLQSCANELEEVGVELKDWSAGVVDFPAFAAGRQVHLCWQHGEECVHYWHESGCDCGTREELASLMAQVESA